MEIITLVSLLAIFVTQLINHKNLKDMKEIILALKAEVAETKGAVASASKLLAKMSAKLNEIAQSGDIEALKELAAELDSSNADLAQAVAENALPEEEEAEGEEEAQG